MSATSPQAASPEQRKASDPAASIWVSASAGSGKTRVLIDRLLRLLLGGTPAHRVLCVTFTKAAAAEMAGRLFGQLAEWVVAGDDELRAKLKALTGAAVTQDECDAARRLFAQVLDAPGGLKIQTIHALCESLLARFPLEARVPTHFQVLEEGLAIELLIAARDQVLETARTQKGTPLAAAVAMLGEISSENAFADIMRALTGARAKIRKAFEAHGGLEGVVAARRTHLGVGPDETDASVVQAACADGTFDELGLRRIAGAMLADSAAEQDRAAILTDWLAKPKHREDMFDDYAGVTLTKNGTPRKTLATKKTIAAQADAADVLGVEASRLMAVAAQRTAVAAAERAEALLVIGEALLGAFEAEKKRHARLDYEDLIVETQRLLRRPGVAPWVLFKLDGGIDHILLDEAQDTSPDQWDIVAALADEFFAGAGAREAVRSVFVVGDEKQSIFSFQGADPDAFEEMHSHFQQRIEGADYTWRALALTRSFRSAPAVLSVIDKVFEAGAGAGVIAGKRWPRHHANRKGHGGLVELWPAIKPEAGDDDDPWQLPLEQGMAVSAEAQLAGRIAECIGGWLREQEELAARGRPITPGDVMILVRRRNLFFEEMVRALKQRRIAVAGTDRMVLTQQLAVMDLMALGHFALLPEDNLNLAIVLKSPLLGFDDARLFALAHDRGKASLWSTLRRRRTHADDFARAYQTLSGILARADLVPPFDFFAEVLGGGGRERLLGRLGPEADDPIDEFLNRALAFERDHAPSLEGFLHWLETGEAEVKRDLDQGRDEVRVMTVHGAKGLQSPIVFLPDTCAVPPKRESLLWTSDDPPLMLWPLRKDLDDAVTARAREAHGEAQMAEYRRLLYVAMTRAEDRLYVCGWETTRGRADGCWYDLVAAAMQEIGKPLDVTVEEDEDAPDTGLRYTEEQSVRPEAGAAPAMAAPPAAMPPWITAPPPPEAPLAKPLAPSRPLGDEPPVQAPLGPAGDGSEPFRRGTILHRLLQFLPDVAPDRRAAAAARYLARPTMGLGDDERAEWAAEALAVLAEPAFAEVFAPNALAEAPIAGVVGEFILSGQIDRLAIGETEVLVVDYKTNREPPASEADIPAAYVRQMAAYRAALQAIYPEKSIRCALLWTAAPRLIELSEAALDKAAP